MPVCPFLTNGHSGEKNPVDNQSDKLFNRDIQDEQDIMIQILNILSILVKIY